MFREFVAAKRRARAENEARVIVAWHTAVFVGQAWAGKLKPLEQILQKRTAALQSVAQQTAVVQQLSARLGIPLKKTRLIRREAKT